MKRVLSFLMALVLTFGLVSLADLTVFAAMGVPNEEREIKIEIAKYKVGEPIPQVPQVTLYMPGTITEIAWSSDYTGTFEDWGRYSFNMTLEAPEGQTFTSGDIQYYNVANSWCFGIQYSDDGKQVHLNLGVETSYYRCYNANIDAVLDNLQPGEVFTPNVYLLSGAVETMYVQWVDPVSKQGVNQLQMGSTYCVDMALRPAEYFRFSESFNVEVCNVPLEWKFPGSEVVIVSDQELHIYIPYLFAEEIEELQVTASEPQLGMAFSELTATADGTAELESIRVHDGYTGQLLEEGTFQEGYLYHISYVFTPAAGYKFADFVALEVETPYSYSWSTDERELYFDYYYQEGGKEVSTIEIEAPIPTPGTSTYDYVLEAPEGAPYIIQYVGWNDLTVEDYNPREFTENHRYLMVLELSAAPGYCFDGNMQILINGQEARWSGGVDSAHIMTEIVISLVENEQYIDYAEIQIDGIKPGGKTRDVVVTIPEDAPYTIREVFVQDTKDWNLADTFRRDSQYRVGVTLQPKEGYVFAEHMDGAVNGQQYRPWTYNYGAGTEFGYDVSFVVERVDLGELPYRVEEGPAEIPVVEETYGQAEITNIQWLNAAKEPVSRFTSGQAYYLAVELTGAGYRTFREGELELQLQNYIPYEITYTKEKTAVILFKYSNLLPAIDKIELELPIPQAGMDVQDLIPKNEQLKLTNFSVYYYEQGYAMQEGVIEENGTYQIYMGFAPAGEYKFADDMQLVIKDGFPYAVEHGHIASEMDLYYIFSTKETIPTVQIDATMPVPNMSASDCTVSAPEDAPYTVAEFFWRDTQTDEPPEIFEADSEYRVHIRLAAKDGYVFDQQNTTVLLNGEEVGWTIEDGGRTLCIYYWHNFRIERVMLGELPYMIEPGKAVIPEIECLSEDVTITNVMWMDYERYLPVNEFEDGKAYYLAVAMKAAEGKIFYLTDDFYIEHWNGTTQDFSPIDNDKLIAYFRYSLEPDAGKVTITPGDWSVGTDIEDITVKVDGKAAIEYLDIYDTDTYEDVINGKIEPNKSYCITISFIPKLGYRFGDETRFEFASDAYVTDWWGGEGYRVMEIYFSTKEKINEVKIDLEGVGIGKSIANVKAKIPADAPYSVNLSWYDTTDGWKQVDENAVFQDGHKYEMSIRLVANENYVFANKCSLTINGKQKELQIYSSGAESYTWDTVSYLKPIDKIELPAMPSSIKKGQTLPTDFQVDKNAHYTLTAEWGIVNEGAVDKVDKNASYVLAFMVTAEKGYEVTEQTKVYVGGRETLSYINSGDGITVYKVYNIGVKEIDRVDLTVPVPEAGKTAGEATAAKDALYQVEQTIWAKRESGVNVTEPISKFTKGEHVMMMNVLYAGEGYVFDEEAAIYVNGKKATVLAQIHMGQVVVVGIDMGVVGEEIPEEIKPEKLDAPKLTAEGKLLTWNDVGATSYEIYRSTKKSSGFKKIITVFDTVYADEVEGGKTYYYRIVAVSAAGSKYNSGNSNVISVDYKLAAPAISAEINLDTGKTVITWEKVAGAKSYDVYRATEVDGKYTKLGNTKNLSYTDSKAAVGAEYYYKVVAVASSSKYNSDYSNIYMSYAILGRPDVDIEIDEASGKPSLSWDKISGAKGYAILRKLSGEEDFSVLTEVTDTSFTDTTAPLDTVCSYIVIALHVDDIFNGAYSEIVEATVTFGRPVLKGGNDEEGKIVLNWNAIDGAVSYDVLRSTKSNKDFKVIATVTEGTTFVDTEAEGGKTYYYQVVAAGENTKSKASASLKMTGTCAAPEIIIGRVAATGKLVVEWEKVSGAKSYEVWRATTADGKYVKIGTSKTTEYIDTKSEVGKTYYYKVLAVGSKKAYNSVFSNIESWSAVLARPSVKITIDEASGKPELSWGKISGAVGYRIIRSLYDWGSAVELIDVTGTSFTDTTAPLDSNCSYAVIALYGDEQFNSVESNIVKETVTFGRPAVKGSINGDGQPVLTWNAIDGALKYEVLRSTKSNKGFALIATVEEGTAYTDETATPGKTYYYQVVAVGENTKSKASSAVKLTGTCAAPVVDIRTDPETGKPVISWEKVSGAKSYDVYYATSANGKYKKLGNTKNLTYTDTKIAIGATRYYKVVAVGSKKAYNSPMSNMVAGMGFCAAPDVKTKVDTATGKPSLSWSKVSGAVSYRIFRIISTEGGDFVEIANISKTTFIDTTAPIDTKCIYMVQAMHKVEGLSSAFSAPVEVTSGIAQPDLSAGLNSDGQPRFNWQLVEGAVKYEIYRSTKSATKGFELYAVKEDGNAFMDTDVVAGKTYYYKVVAVGAVGRSVESAVVKLTATCAVPQPSATQDDASGKPGITWEKIPGAKSYEIYRSTNKYEGKYTKIGTSKTTSFVDTKAVPGTTYFYKVKAIGSKKSYNSDLSQPTMGVTAYAAQPQVTVKFDSKGVPVISWKKISEADKYYLMYVDVTQFADSEEGPSQDYIAENMQYVEISKKKTSYTMTQAEIGHAYIITMVTVPKNAEFFSLPSEPQYIERACVAPKIKAKYIEGYNCGDWSDVPGADFYNIYCATSKKGEYEYIGYVENDSSFVHLNAVKGKTYYYKVTACTYNSDDTTFTESAFSNVISIKTKK